MRTYNKTLDPLDYAAPGMGLWVMTFDWLAASAGAPYNANPHLHRRWEYGMAMSFIGELAEEAQRPLTVLDVGGGGSLFPAMAMYHGLDVTVVDPDPSVYMVESAARWLGKTPQVHRVAFEDYEAAAFDVAVSLSTIEHVEDDKRFIAKLADYARLGVFLTTDFSMDGGRYSAAHLRTYTPKTLRNKLAMTLAGRASLYGEEDWADRGAHVFGYNFASLAMVREEA